MENQIPPEKPPLCPSARPEMAGAIVFGVVVGTPERLRVAYLAEPRPVTDELVELCGPVRPTGVFRIGAPCAGHACGHFDGVNCQLVTRIVRLLPPVVDGLPACHLRPDCRWWQQEGKAACFRCPQIATETRHATDLARQAAGPDAEMIPM